MTSARGHHCNEFTRSSLIRRGAAEAGRGLPAIEAGMNTVFPSGNSRVSASRLIFGQYRTDPLSICTQGVLPVG